MDWFYTRLYASLRTLAWSVAAAACLGACSSGSLRSFFGPPDDEVDVAVAPPPPPPPSPSTAPARPARSKPAPARPARPVVPAPVISVAGLGEDEVQRILGEPQERSMQDGRKTWVYKGAGCRVEVTFFRDVTRETYSALAHKVVRTDTGAAVDPGTPCLRGVRSAAR